MGKRGLAEKHAIELSATYADATRGAKVDGGKAKFRPAVAKELEAFFDRSDSDFGMRSKFSSLILMAMSGGMSPSGRNGTEDAMLREVRGPREARAEGESKIGVQRAVRAALHAIGDPHATVLWAAHGHFVVPPEVKAALGVVGRVALMTASCRKGFQESQRKDELLEAWLVRACKRAEDIEAIHKEAELMLSAAHVAYAAEREPKAGQKGVGAFRRREPGEPAAPKPERQRAERRSVADHFAVPEGWVA